MRRAPSNTTLKTLTFATIVAGAITLAECTSTPTPTPTTTSTAEAAPSASASASETPAPAAQGSTGDILDADTAQALNGAVRTAFELGEATVGFGIRP